MTKEEAMTTLPTSLVRFQAELEAAIVREQARRSRRRPRLVLRLAVGAGAAAVLAVGALTTLPGGAGGPVKPASAAQRAAAVLTAARGSIVHTDLAVTQRNADGSETRWRVQSWQQTAPPYEQRQIVTGESGEPVETATVGGSLQRYDPHSNTVYVSRPGDPAAGATPQPATAEPFREQVLDLLRSGKLKESGRATVGGRETISFTWTDGHTHYEYTVEAGSYEPVRWRFSPGEGRSETLVSFDTYEVIPAGETSLDLTRRHPDATVNRRP